MDTNYNRRASGISHSSRKNGSNLVIESFEHSVTGERPHQTQTNLNSLYSPKHKDSQNGDFLIV
jgi:hypothetical protein